MALSYGDCEQFPPQSLRTRMTAVALDQSRRPSAMLSALARMLPGENIVSEIRGLRTLIYLQLPDSDS